jgi:hypothetical protein
MFEKILLSVGVTFSLYLCLQSPRFYKTPGVSVVQLQEIPEQTVNHWQ